MQTVHLNLISKAIQNFNNNLDDLDKVGILCTIHAGFPSKTDCTVYTVECVFKLFMYRMEMEMDHTADFEAVDVIDKVLRQFDSLKLDTYSYTYTNFSFNEP